MNGGCSQRTPDPCGNPHQLGVYLVDKRFRVGHSVFLFLIGCSNLPLALSISMSTLSVHTAR